MHRYLCRTAIHSLDGLGGFNCSSLACVTSTGPCIDAIIHRWKMTTIVSQWNGWVFSSRQASCTLCWSDASACTLNTLFSSFQFAQILCASSSRVAQWKRPPRVALQARRAGQVSWRQPWGPAQDRRAPVDVLRGSGVTGAAGGLQDVRRRVISALPPDPASTLPALLQRARDVDPEVRSPGGTAHTPTPLSARSPACHGLVRQSWSQTRHCSSKSPPSFLDCSNNRTGSARPTRVVAGILGTQYRAGKRGGKEGGEG